ncbi:MAG TPA: methionine synthase [Cyanobacteria bacterium UBA8803]|nr:methionine synthase [Cyanobacteria bacterium UBA9273]HBL57282.1 methionine synthase [Cyanobacteria bacterium UBA8803]
MKGIYTLANDAVYDQLIAFVNSVNMNIGENMSICIIPYNDKMDKIKEAIKDRPNVSIFNDLEALEEWDRFCFKCWAAHPKDKASRWSRPRWYKTHNSRELVAFDGEFEEFVFFDADTLVMKPLDDVFEKLEQYDLVFDDWEHTKKDLSTQLDIAQISQDQCIPKSEIYPLLHCDSFFSSKKGIFSYKSLGFLSSELINNKKISWVKDHSWWSASALFCCMTLLANYRQFNFTQSEISQERTGNCADADPFVNLNNVLYNKEGLKPIHRIHYMNYSISQFRNLCNGIHEDVRYKDIFLHYRFLRNPEQNPSMLRRKNIWELFNEKKHRLENKVRRTLM